MKLSLSHISCAVAVCASVAFTYDADAAIALDRTRVIFNGSEESMTVTLANNNKELPYLSQSWIEDSQGNKIGGPLMALPPIQRIEPGAKSLVKIQMQPGAQAKLPQDRESLFYFNVREIPPRSKKTNVLQLALQTRVKLFYRPVSLIDKNGLATTPWQEKLTLTRKGDRFTVNNPTPYYVTLISSNDGDFKPLMLNPKSSEDLGVRSGALGNNPRISYINDWGGRPELTFSCKGETCVVTSNKAG
ncbi:fimbria/pilus periplasmic chaperone [Lelliottia nimipressuralis]|jgi:P pilus assembly chaperone PapD|uniref:fimbria/pilus periplasmic chaperone n=1 Tax=Lelliottia nimipressuralis TaxID=69220 RepID=UPI003D21FEEE